MSRWRWPALASEGGGGASAKSAALMSVLFGADAMYSFLYDGTPAFGAIDTADYSGNGVNLTIPNSITAEDLIPGATRIFNPGTSVLTPRGGAPTLPIITGEFTLVVRMRPSAYNPGAVPGHATWVWSQGSYLPSPSMVAMFLNPSPDTPPNDFRVPTYYAQDGAGYVLWSPTNALQVADGKEHFVTLRRSADRTIATIGVDGVYQTSPSLRAVDPPVSSQQTWMSEPTPGFYKDYFYGSMGNSGIWCSVALSDAQLLVLQKQAMGL